MRPFHLSTVVLLLSILVAGTPLVASDEAKPDTDTATVSVNKELKSVSRGVLQALFPGVIFHGAGNFYAESYLLGTALLTTEIAGILIMKIAYNSYYTHGFKDWLFHSEWRDKYNTWMGIGVGLFIASWIADIITTPMMVNKYNRRIEREGLSLAIGTGGYNRDLITVGVSFAF